MSYKRTLIACSSVLVAFLTFGGAASVQELTTPKVEIGLNCHRNEVRYSAGVVFQNRREVPYPITRGDES
jgi:hypothetical protein